MDKEIDRIQKNPETDIVIRIDEYMGRKGLTIREFVKSERYTGFTKAGTRIPADKFKIFKQAINAVNEKDMEEINLASNETHMHNKHNQQDSKLDMKKDLKLKVGKDKEMQELEF